MNGRGLQQDTASLELEALKVLEEENLLLQERLAQLEQAYARTQAECATLQRCLAALEDEVAVGRTLIEQFPGGLVLVFDRHLRYVEANGRAIARGGIERSMLLGRTMWEVLPADVCAVLEPVYRAALGGQESAFQMKFMDGDYQVHVLPVRTMQGQVIAGVVIAYDITAQVVAAAQLQANEALLQRFLDYSPGLIYVYDREERYLLVNDNHAAGLNLSREQVIGRCEAEFFPSEVVAAWREVDRQVVATGQPLEMEELVPRADGLRTFLSVKFPLFNEQGAIYAIGGISTDITERKQMEQALRASEEQYRALFDAVPIGLYRSTPEGRLLDINPAGAHMLGYDDASALINANVLPHYVDGDARRWWQACVERDGVVRKFEMQLRRQDGMLIWVVDNARGVRDASGRIVVYEGSIEDISERKQAEAALQQSNAELTHWVEELQQRNREMTLLGELGDLLQICRTAEEAWSVVGQIGPQLFPAAGALALLNAARTQLEVVTSWGVPPIVRRYGLDDCWALRRGRVYLVQEPYVGLRCQHVVAPIPESMLCVPVMAQGELLGALHLCMARGQFVDANWQLATTVADHIGLALANVMLQETLRYQAIRDPLTGLFNRRYMEESLERELSRAMRHHASLGIIMLDLDYFKRFNDTFGHAAGDSVLRELGGFLQAHMRGEDIACRYGGEEFTLILLDAPLAAVAQRAEQIRAAVRRLTIRYRGQSLGAVTCSLGIAMFPEHGVTGEELVRAADLALYRSKAEGRDRVSISQVFRVEDTLGE